MERLKERLAIAQRALTTLEELLALPHMSPVERDAAIQRFEYTFEACWRAAQRYLLVVGGGRYGLIAGPNCESRIRQSAGHPRHCRGCRTPSERRKLRIANDLDGMREWMARGGDD